MFTGCVAYVVGGDIGGIMGELMSLHDAVDAGIRCLRRTVWASTEDYMEIDIIGGRLGPWLHLYSPLNEAFNGRNPIDFLITEFDLKEKGWEVHECIL